MDGDLSLSQSLGGLRIANPDNASTNTSEGPSTSSMKLSSIGHDAPEAPVGPEQPQPSNPSVETGPSPAQQASASNTNLHDYSGNSPPQLTANILPNMGHHASRQSVCLPPNHQPSSRGEPYRLRTDSSLSATEYPSRIDSRGGSAALQAGVLPRDEGHTDRSYASTKPFPRGGAPLPPRQSSRRAPNTSIPPVPGSYGNENAPLHSSEEWQERGAAVGVQQEIDANGKPVARYVKKGVRDFVFGRTLGEGSYSQVVAATDRQTLKEYAIKILDKRHIIKEKKVKYVNIEKDTLNRLTDHPGVVRLYYTFQDERSLYFVLDLAGSGELLGVLKRMGTFDEECTKFYGAQILDTIGYMHRRGVIHRDLKPENVLLDNQMHVKITDFGTAKILSMPSPKDGGNDNGIPSMDTLEDDRARSFVGTAEYVSPELLTNKSACKASDLWAFGCIIFQLLAGRPPFKAANEYLTFQKIVALEYEFPKGFPSTARDLVERLLVHDPNTRLQIEHIKNHEFFNGITWGRELWKQKPPRLKSYSPPTEPIKLNGPDEDDSFPPNINMKPSAGMHPPSIASQNRSYPPMITELPPPSQLDIEWSPVLTQTNERILKLGNLTVSTSSAPRSQNKNGNGDGDTPKKLSRFFGGSTTKKRQRLVLVTSAGRVIIVPAGGEDKRSKMDITLLSPDTQYRSITDSKGYSSWAIDTREKHHVFEETKPSSDAAASKLATQEWLEVLDRAKELASVYSTPNSYAGDDGFRDLSSGVSSHANTLNHADDSPTSQYPQSSGRNALSKPSPEGDSKSKKRFSRRHSRNGLSAVF
ncbi:AGC/PDK1 protein kinase [Nannizzia gypsea CBS 118893]|uniref:non-specific serine/threonine protein kinase n=1 Tax=Arthroderma gypseum (strain ATCC MYA-4604 / CBS 118893) TaxID=535722 RepID=E5R1W2_ARTGP|nr:AGC/PDK1 protein kinase [Nannizzia gypsea CBS 118893]EFQ98596.1 AGC/PDK1 protein kinase [Nannizzia gypsea CBS 118893]